MKEVDNMYKVTFTCCAFGQWITATKTMSLAALEDLRSSACIEIEEIEVV